MIDFGLVQGETAMQSYELIRLKPNILGTKLRFNEIVVAQKLHKPCCTHNERKSTRRGEREGLQKSVLAQCLAKNIILCTITPRTTRALSS